MNTMRKKSALFLAVLFILALFAGCGGSSGGSIGAAGPVSGWKGDFNGTTLPAPETKGKITEWTVEDDAVTVRIDGMSYEEYKVYCSKLEALDGWEVYDGEDTSRFPDDYNELTKVKFTGIYGDLPHIAVQYYSDSHCESSGYPHFCMFIFTEW